MGKCNRDCFNCIFDDCIESDRKIFEKHESKVDWKNQEERKAYMKKYRAVNQSRIKANKHEYYLKNREKLLEYSKDNYRKRRGDKNV